MEPKRVIEARDLEAMVEHRAAMRAERGVEQRQVRQIEHRSAVKGRIVGSGSPMRVHWV